MKIMLPVQQPIKTVQLGCEFNSSTLHFMAFKTDFSCCIFFVLSSFISHILLLFVLVYLYLCSLLNSMYISLISLLFPCSYLFSNRALGIWNYARTKVDPNTGKIMDDAQRFFLPLIELCEKSFEPPPSNSKSNKKAKPESLLLSFSRVLPRFLQIAQSVSLILPLSSFLTVTLPPVFQPDLWSDVPVSQQATLHHDQNKHFSPVASAPVLIHRVHDQIQLIPSKERPKKITFLGSDGNPYSFLCKREQKGDIRKNSRIMEFFTVLNRLFKVTHNKTCSYSQTSAVNVTLFFVVVSGLQLLSSSSLTLPCFFFPSSLFSCSYSLFPTVFRNIPSLVVVIYTCELLLQFV
jgi:hypothetical protein